MQRTVTDAFEIYGPAGTGPFLFTCEHASARVPAPARSSAADRPWLETHWGHDIGGRSLGRELVRLTESRGIFARFSRLVCDANREPEHPDLIRAHTEGHPLSFNLALTEGERRRRILAYHEPYHQAIDVEVARHVAGRGSELLLLSLHTFTPVWEGQVRPMDIGVLFSDHDALAEGLAGELEREGLRTALNEPYSGKEGLIYAAARHGAKHRVVYLELEVNQALLGSPAAVRRVARRIAAASSRLRRPG